MHGRLLSIFCLLIFAGSLSKQCIPAYALYQHHHLQVIFKTLYLGVYNDEHASWRLRHM